MDKRSKEIKEKLLKLIEKISETESLDDLDVLSNNAEYTLKEFIYNNAFRIRKKED